MAITPRTTAVFEVQGASLPVNTNTGSTGDYVVMSVATDGTAINTPTGWSPLFTELDQVVNNEVFGRFLDGTSNDDPTVTSTGATRLTVIVQPFGGVDTTTPMDATPVTTNGSSTSSLSPPAITTVTAGAYAVAGVAIDASAETYRFTVSGTGWLESGQTAGTARRQATAIKSVPTPTSSGQATFSQSGGALWTVGWTIALRPAPSSPVFKSASSAGKSTGNPSSFVITKPSGLAVDDLMVGFHSGDADVVTSAISFPANWNPMTPVATNDATNNAPGGKIGWKIATSTDVAASNFTFASDTNGDATGHILVFEAGTFDPANPITMGTWTTLTRAAAGLSQTAPSMTGVADAVLCAAFCADTNAAQPNQAYPSSGPSGMTLRGSINVSGTTPYSLSGIYTQTLSAGGATGAKTVTPTNATENNGYASVQFLVNPGTGGGSPGGGGTTAPVDQTWVHAANGSNSVTNNVLPMAYPAVTIPSGGKACYYMVVHTKPSSHTVPTPSGWTLVGSYSSTNATAFGADTGPTKVTVFKRESDTALTGTETITFGVLTNQSQIGVIHGVTAAPDAGGTLTFEEDWFGGYTLGPDTATPFPIGGNFTISAGDLADKDHIFLFAGHSGDNRGTHTWGSVSCTGATFGTPVGAANGPTAAQTITGAGNDSGLGGWRVPVTGGPNSGTTLTWAATTATGTAASGSQIGFGYRVRAMSTATATAPVASAGADATVSVNQTFSRLGTGTNTPTSYAWSIVSGPTGVGTTIDSDAQLDWAPTVAGTYVLRLTATNAGGSGTDDLTLTVNPLAPVASAGADATVVVNTAFTRTGSGTNSPTSYAWTIQAGPTGVGSTIGSAAALNWTPTQTGTYTLRLTATNAGGSGTDDLILTVNPAAPVADAGADASHTVNTAFTRTGTATNSPTSYAWTIQSGPAGVGTTIGSTAALNWTPTTLGTYVLRLTATNVTGSGTDDVTVTVNPPPPVANAGADATVVVNTAFTRTGSGTNSPTGYAWTLVSGPGVTPGTNIGNAAALSYTPTQTGTYVIRLTANNAGGSGTDDLTLTVNPPAPVASAGVDATIVLGAAFTRTGSGTNSPTSYSWSVVSGPAEVGNTIGSAAALNWTPSAVGTYVIRLTATNVTGSGTDDLTLVVNPPAPVANAGADANITLGATFSRTGSATNSPTGYAWTIVSGPAGVTAGTNIGNVATLSYQPTIVGTYVLRLTATNVTGSGTDDLTLTVSYDTPTASAGVDAGINLGSAFSRTATEDAKTAPVVSRAWTVLSGPNQVGNTLATAAAVNWTPTVAGTFVLRYTFVTDGGSVTDDVQVVVTLQPPTANAGVDASTLVNQLFTRTATETGVNITARAWTIEGGPTGVGSTIGTAAALSWTPTQPGSYTLRYTVTNAAGSAFDEMILTVNGPPVVDSGADSTIANRTPVFRTATETGGGGVTAREWKITAGPQLNTVLGNTSTLDWTPTLPGTYTVTYSATNPYGTGTDSFVVTVTAIVIGLSGTRTATSSIVSPNLARRARITMASSSVTVSSIVPVALKRIRKVAGTKSATSSFVAGKPRLVTRNARTISANSPVITAALVTRRTFKETVVESSTTTATGKLRLVTRGGGTSTQTTATVSGTIATARKMAGQKSAISSLASATLRGVTRHVKTIAANVSATLHAELVTRLTRTISGQALVRTANLGVQQQGAAQASASTTITGDLISVPRLTRTVTATSSVTRKLGRTTVLNEIADGKLVVSKKLNSTIRETETVVQAGVEHSVQLSLAALMIYDGMIARGVIYIQEGAGGILRQLSGQARAITQLPQIRLNRATRHSRTVTLNSYMTVFFGRVLEMSGSTTAYTFVPGTNLVRLGFFEETVSRAQSSMALNYSRRVSVFVRRAAAISSTSRRLNGAYRFSQILIRARSRFQERSGYAALTTAKAVTTSPQNTSRYVKKMAGYVTALSGASADLVVALPRVGYAEAKATATGNLVRVDPIEEAVVVDARMTADEKGVGKLSTIIRIFENEELDAYINNENYTGSNLVAVAAPPPRVFRRVFMRPR